MSDIKSMYLNHPADFWVCFTAGVLLTGLVLLAVMWIVQLNKRP